MIFVYAGNNNNFNLRKKSSFTRSMVMHFSQSDIISVDSLLIGEAKNLESEFEVIGLKPEDIAEFEKLLNEYRDAHTKPREMIVNRSVVTMELRAAFLFADMLLKEQADKLILGFKKTLPISKFNHPSFGFKTGKSTSPN